MGTERQTGAGQLQRGLQREKLTQDSDHKGPEAGQSEAEVEQSAPEAAAGSESHRTPPETPRMSWAYRLQPLAAAPERGA